MKVSFPKTNINNKDLNKSLNIFTEKTIKAVRKKAEIKPAEFSEELTVLGINFEKKDKKGVLNNACKMLAEKVVSLGDNNLAGIIYSFLIKFNEGNAKLVEDFATNALAIAKRQHDPVHIMARANDLREAYKIIPPKNEKFMSVLYDEKHALNDIINNYDKLQKQSKNLKPKENYQALLAEVKCDIAKRHKDQNIVKQEFAEAKELYETLGLQEKANSIIL